jgi:hypothetical protein
VTDPITNYWVGLSGQALEYARPWRRDARAGEIYERHRSIDSRSEVRTEF